MSFNADKCFTLHITRKRKTVEYNYMLHDHKLKETTDSKYLGVIISNDLSWATHIRNISAKANRTIGVLRRNIHSCPKVVKAAAYTTLVRPSIEYVSAIWDPYAKNQTMQLDAIQRRAARFVNNNCYDREPGSVKAMISDLSWESLEQRRAKTRAVLMYKIANNLVDIPSTLLIPADARTSGNTVFKTIYTRSDVYKYSYFPHTIITWSYIPQLLRKVSTIDQFCTGLWTLTLSVQSEM